MDGFSLSVKWLSGTRFSSFEHQNCGNCRVAKLDTNTELSDEFYRIEIPLEIYKIGIHNMVLNSVNPAGSTLDIGKKVPLGHTKNLLKLKKKTHSTLLLES